MTWKMMYVMTMVAVLSCWRVRVQAGGSGSDLYLSTAETALLLESESQLLEFVHRCLTRTAANTGNGELSRLARELQTELNALPQTQDARHPLDAYVGLRRFTQYWGKYISRLDPVVARSVEKSLANNRIVYPDKVVLQQARRAIVRLQAACHLNTSLLLISASTNLSAADVASLAAEAEVFGFTAVADDWKRLAVSLFPASLQDFSSGVSLARRDFSKNDHVEIEETNIIQRRHSKFFSLCQHLQNSSDLSGLRSERCEYRVGTVPLNRWKTEVLSTDPYVVLFYDFISDQEATFLVNNAMRHLVQAYTGAKPQEFGLKVPRRLGKVAWVREVGSNTALRITRRIEEVTGLHAAFRPAGSFGEDFQVLNYGIGGHYIPHHDYFKVKNAFSAGEPYLRESGDRAATFMIYLGDVSRGGATVFPELGIGAPPIKKAALFWYNFTPDGLPDPRSLHGGCPVIIGQKWVANKWIHEISTAMTRTCHTTPWKAGNT